MLISMILTLFQSRTYFLFAGLNLIWIPIVYLCRLILPDQDDMSLTVLAVYPETSNRSLESIEALFSKTSSPFYWKMEQAYKLHGDVLAEHGVTKDEHASADKLEWANPNVAEA